MRNRITIQTQSLDEGRDIIDGIGDLIEAVMLNTTSVTFCAKPDTNIVALSKLLEVPVEMKGRGYLPAHEKSVTDWDLAPDWATFVIQLEDNKRQPPANYYYSDDTKQACIVNTPSGVKGAIFDWWKVFPSPHRIKVIDDRNSKSVTVTRYDEVTPDASALRPVTAEVARILQAMPVRGNTMDLATQMAWLEGLSVYDDAPGQRYCMVHHAAVNTTVRYDPIGRPAIRQCLIEKYKLDLHWIAEGECVVSKFGDPLTSVGTDMFGGCIGSAIVQCIINLNRGK